MVVERWPHFYGQALHNVLYQRLSDGNAVKILLVVEVLHDVQVSLQGLDLGGEVLGDFLDGLVAREEVEYLVDVSPKMSILPNSSINLVLNVGQSMMLLKGPCLARGMA